MSEERLIETDEGDRYRTTVTEFTRALIEKGDREVVAKLIGEEVLWLIGSGSESVTVRVVQGQNLDARPS